MKNIEIVINNPDMDELCMLYWHLDDDGKFTYKLSEIAKKTNCSPTMISKLVIKSCTAYSNYLKCEKCNTPFILMTRSDYKLHLKNNKNWTCKDCVIKQEKILEEQMKELQFSFIESRKVKSSPITDFTLKQCVYLLSLIRHSASEDLDFFHPIGFNKLEKLTPLKSMDVKIIEYLLEQNLIELSHKTPFSALSFYDGFENYDLNEVAFNVPLGYGSNFKNLLDKITNLLSDDLFIASAHAEFNDLVKEISIMECLAYLEKMVEQYNLILNIGDKTRRTIEQALENFSVAQVYNFIWGASKDATAYFLKGGISRLQAGNSIVGNIQKRSERALAENWHVKAYKRNYELPQSQLSQIIFNSILKRYDSGFTELLSDLKI